MKNPVKIDDFGVTLFLETPNMFSVLLEVEVFVPY